MKKLLAAIVICATLLCAACGTSHSTGRGAGRRNGRVVFALDRNIFRGRRIGFAERSSCTTK